MSQKSWNLDRRTFLRGLGVAAALPFLEGMSWAIPQGQGPVPKRLCYVYFPNGCSLPGLKDKDNAQWRWFPTEAGKDYKLTNVLKSLEPYRDQMSLLGGLSHPKSRQLLGHLAGDTYLTAGDVRGDRYQNRISVDQVAAQQFKKHTRFPSLALSVDGGVGYKSRVSTLSFSADGRPIPSEHRHRQIFERYFSTGGSQEERRKSLQQGKKIVDLVLEDSKSLKKQLSKHDQAKMDEYLESLNSVEEQVRRNEAWLDIPMKEFDASNVNFDADPRVDPKAYVRATYDLMALALQTDLTRVMTYMCGREDGMGFGDNFPNLALGIQKGHHTISHDTGKGHWPEWGRYDQWVAEQFTYFIDKLANTQDEFGPLLDNTLVLYGSACSTTHNARNYPTALLGGKALGAQHGSYTLYDNDTPFSNLFVSMLNAVDVKTETFADSTGPIPGLFA
ncbi:MAG: DUF1552 domain-containing protein [Planctomycetes bacterium]|nr:DUF1552 domain-containing protein [Planctomycetota bacterium]MCP4771160.1 DUF1552 domain-containing protein [Planctomycetota bacterium]MCP4862113.1 DUF1552 domain-containing protein [Planctomycetota bacterium]